MLGIAPSTLQEIKNLYFNQIDPNRFSNFQEASDFVSLFFLFLLFLTFFHAIAIYLLANVSNSYKYFHMILISAFYAIAVAFSLSKIFQTFFAIFLGYVPFAAVEMAVFNTYGSLAITYLFEVLLVNNRLKVLFERGKLDTAPIGSDIFLGVTVANLITLLFFIFIN